MKWNVVLKVKDYIRSWSDQTIDTKYKDVSVHIEIKDLECHMCFDGEENIEETFYLLWELFFLYDGYFYVPISLEVDGKEVDTQRLIRVPFYVTDRQWYESELLGRGERDLSAEVIERYALFRNTGMKDQKMIKTIVNAFFYLHSEAYGRINSNHRLSLLLNLADGFVINTFKDTNNVKANLERMFKKTVDIQRVKRGIILLGMQADQFQYNLAEERKAFDHYIYSANSIAAFVFDSEDEKSNFITWYFVYILELVIRLNFLKEIGVEIEQEIRDYALDVIVDWIIYENDLEEDCTTPYYRLRQLGRKMNR